MDLSALPKEVRDQLAELDLELSEGKTNGGRGGGGRGALAAGEEGCFITDSEAS